MLCQKAGQSKHDQPVSRRRLLYLHMAGCEQRAELCQLIKAHKQDVYDKGDQQKDHRVAEALSEYFLHARGYRILSEIRIDYHSVDLEYVL